MYILLSEDVEVDENVILKNKNLKSRKRRIKFGIFLTLLIITVVKIMLPFFILPNEIRELNKNSNLPYKLATPLEEYCFEIGEWECYKQYNNIISFYNDNNYLTFNGFPDMACSYKLTYYATSRPEINIFGVKVGNTLEETDRILKKNHYKLEYKEYSYATYKKGRIKIDIGIKQVQYSTDTEELLYEYVDSISIYLHYTDWLHKGYYK